MRSDMTLNPADEAVLASIKYGHALEIDSLNLQPDWLENAAARAAATAALNLARLNKKVDLVNIRIHPAAKAIPRDQWGPVAHVFLNGHKDVTPVDAVRAAHDYYVIRRGEEILQKYNRLYNERRQMAADEIPTLAQEMTDLYAGAKITKCRPSDVYAEEVPELKYKSPIPQVNEMLGGGWRNGMLYLYLGPPGHGKTSALRSDACAALTQKKKVVYVVTENTTAKAFQSLLRALTGLSEQEIKDRKGNTDQRDQLLQDWVKWCDQYLTLYGMDRCALPWIERILAWDKPDLLLIDYIRKLSGMTGVKGFVEDPVGDYTYALLDYSNHFGVAIGSAGQMSAKNAADFAKGKFLEDAPPFYGTDRPRQATDLYIGVRRAHNGGTAFYKWKDRYGNPIHTGWVIPFDSNRQALALPRV